MPAIGLLISVRSVENGSEPKEAVNGPSLGSGELDICIDPTRPVGLLLASHF